jgi:putative transposase
MDPRLRQDLAILHLAGISNRVLAMISKKVLGIKVGKDMVNESIGLLTERALVWLNRPITKKYWALYVDGTNFRIQRRGSTEKEPSLVVLGIDTDGHRSILAISPGNKDNAASWKSLFKELKQRGLDSSCVQTGIMDGLPGLENVFKEEFPSAVTCRCWVHAMRNALNKCPKRLEDPFKAALDKVMYAESYQDAKSKFEELKTIMGSDAGRSIDCIGKDLESLLAHYKFDKRYWRALKTTNPIERINRELKRRTKTMDSIGEQSLNVVVVFVAIKLEYGWSIYTVDDKRHEKLDRLNGKNDVAIDNLFN